MHAALAPILSGCSRGQTLVTFSVVAPEDGMAQVSAAVREREDGELVLGSSEDERAPGWLDERAVLRMNGSYRRVGFIASELQPRQ